MLLEFLTKVLSWTPRVCVAFILFAFALYLLRETDPVRSLDPATFLIIIVAGILALAFVAVDSMIRIWPRLTQMVARWRRYRAKRQIALTSLASLPAECADVLLYLRDNNIRRFLCSRPGGNLYVMANHWCVIDHLQYGYGYIWWAVPDHACYRVPGYVWRQIEQRWGSRDRKDAPVRLEGIRPVPYSRSERYGWIGIAGLIVIVGGIGIVGRYRGLW
jgi:hypothetical protein